MRCHAKTEIHIDIGNGGSHDFVLAVDYDFTPEVRQVGASYLADPRFYDCGAPAEVTISDMQILRSSDRSEVSIPGWLSALVRHDHELEAFLIAEAESAE